MLRGGIMRVAALMGALALAGCVASGGAAPKTVTQQQTVGQLTIRLDEPERAPLLAEQELQVTLTDARGAAVDGAEVWLALVMPTMQMSSNEPDALPVGNGRYRATAIFTMSGTWNLEVHAVVRGQEYVARFRAQTQ